MPTASANWKELLEPGLRQIFSKHLAKKKDYLPLLFNVQDSKKASERNLGTGNFGLMQKWSATGNQVAYQDVSKGFQAQYVHEKYSTGNQIERELYDDDQYGEIPKRVTGLADSVWYTRQTQGASVFNFAFGGGLVGPDGLPLCHAAHPVAPGSGTTYSNLGTLALTDDNVETTRNNMKTWTDDKGNLLAISPDLLVVPPALRKQALVIVDSDKKADSQVNNVNVYKGTMDVIEFDFLTDTNAWFLIDSSRLKRFLNWYDRRKVKMERDEDFDTEVMKVKAVGRWSFGWDDASFIYGNNPS